MKQPGWGDLWKYGKPGLFLMAIGFILAFAQIAIYWNKTFVPGGPPTQFYTGLALSVALLVAGIAQLGTISLHMKLDELLESRDRKEPAS